MVEKIIVNPESVRGYGNIVMPKTGADFEEYNCTMEVSEDTVNGEDVTVYVLTPETTTIALVLSSSVSTVTVGSNVVLSVTVTEDEVPVSGQSVSFKLGSTELGTSTTNSSGVATYTYTTVSSGSLNFSAVYAGHSSNGVSVVVNKKTVTATISASSASIVVGSSVTLTGTVKYNNSGVSGIPVTFKEGTTTVGTGTTNSSGVATCTLSDLTVGSHSFTVTSTSTDVYDTATSSSTSVTVLDHSYSLAFSQSSYPASSGSATLELTLLDNSSPVSGATVSVTGSDSSSYSCITNSSGVGSVTVSNISAETTFTCSYQGVSDTCTVTVGPSYLFYDDCSVDSTSQYGNSILLEGTSTNNLTFSTDHYIMNGTNAGFSGFAIPNCTGVDNVKVRIKFKLTQTNSGAYNQFGVCVCDSNTPSTNMGCRARNDKKFQIVYNSDQGENTIYTPTSYFSSEYYYVELIKQGTSLTIKLYDKNLTQLATNTRTITNYSNPQYIFYNLTVRGTSYATHIQEIIAESL